MKTFLRVTVPVSLGLLSVMMMQVAFTPKVALADQHRVQWADVRGIIQPQNVVGTGTGTATGGGAAWSTTGGTVEVDLDEGIISFDVEGLVLAAGNSIGTRDGVTTVKGTLVCDTNGSLTGNSALIDTDLVTLDKQGNAHFAGSVGALPSQCFESDIAFLVRAASGAWIASGAVRRP